MSIIITRNGEDFDLGSYLEKLENRIKTLEDWRENTTFLILNLE
jgi:hypothetical protein